MIDRAPPSPVGIWEKRQPLDQSTQDEMRFLDGLGTHKPRFTQTHIENLPVDARQSIPKRLRAERQRMIWRRARGVSEQKPPKTKEEWLRAYIRVSARREEWGDIDRIAAVDYAKTLLLKQTQGRF
jgi:hypothetical protein